MNNTAKILFIYPSWASNATFVQRDYETLLKVFSVTKMSFSKNDVLFPLRLLKALLKHHICFAWFGGLHSFYALIITKLLRKKLVIVAGGYDAIYLPKLNYGIRAEKKSGWRRTYYSFRHADRVLAVSKCIRDSLENECRAKKNVELVYNGVDPSSYSFGEQKERFVLTVGQVTERTLIIKGILSFIDVARRVPQEKFVLIGGGNDGAFEQLQKDAPSNVELTGALSSERVREYMRRAMVYVQLSAQESFGVALAEAMLSGCIPVVAKRGALPEVAGPEAFYVDYGDIPGTITAIERAFNAGTGNEQRKWIAENFRNEIRNNKIINLINSLSPL